MRALTENTIKIIVYSQWLYSYTMNSIDAESEVVARHIYIYMIETYSVSHSNGVLAVLMHDNLSKPMHIFRK